MWYCSRVLQAAAGCMFAVCAWRWTVVMQRYLYAFLQLPVTQDGCDLHSMSNGWRWLQVKILSGCTAKLIPCEASLLGIWVWQLYCFVITITLFSCRSHYRQWSIQQVALHFVIHIHYLIILHVIIAVLCCTTFFLSVLSETVTHTICSWELCELPLSAAEMKEFGWMLHCQVYMVLLSLMLDC